MPDQCKFSVTATKHEDVYAFWHPVVGISNSLDMVQTLIIIVEK